MLGPGAILTGWLVRLRNRLVGLDRYPDPHRYFGPGGLPEARALCAEANRDLPGWVRPPGEVAPAGLSLDGCLERPDGIRVEDWSFDSPRPVGDPINDRVHFRLFLPRAASPNPVLAFHHSVYTAGWKPWEWFCAALIRRMPVAMLAAPWHGRRCPPGQFPGEGTINPNPARLFEALRQWCWDHQAFVGALAGARGLRVGAEFGFSLGAFQTLLLAAAGRIDVPIVSCSSTNRYAFGLTQGIIGKGLLRAMNDAGIDESLLHEMTDSLQLERHVGSLHGRPILYMRGSRDHVDPWPSLDRLDQALQPTRSVRFWAGHTSLIPLRRRRAMREVLRFLGETEAFPVLRLELP